MPAADRRAVRKIPIARSRRPCRHSIAAETRYTALNYLPSFSSLPIFGHQLRAAASVCTATVTWHDAPTMQLGSHSSENPEFREISRSSRATRSSSSVFRARRCAMTASLSSSSIRSRSPASRSRVISACSAGTSPGTPGVSGVSGTPELHQSRPCVSNPTRPAGRQSFPVTHPKAAVAGTPVSGRQGPEWLRIDVVACRPPGG